MSAAKLHSLVQTAMLLRETEPRASYLIAKELALIDVGMLWYPNNLNDDIARLISLAQHVALTQKCALGKQLAREIRHTALLLANPAN